MHGFCTQAFNVRKSVILATCTALGAAVRRSRSLRPLHARRVPRPKERTSWVIIGRAACLPANLLSTSGVVVCSAVRPQLCTLKRAKVIP